MTVPILILAGGSSSRMGSRHKLLETVQGQPLLRVQALRALEVSEDVTILIRPEQPALEQAVAGLPVKLLIAPEALEGMGGSIRAATGAFRDRDCFLMLLPDLVEIEADDMHAVIAARDGDHEHWIWRGATQDGKPGHPILFDQAVFGDLLNLDGDTGGNRIMQSHADKVRLIRLPGQRARTDLDTPEDWAAWRAANGDRGLLKQ